MIWTRRLSAPVSVWVFQRLNLFPHLTVLENMSLAPVRLGKGQKKQIIREALDILTRLNIRELADNHPSQISGGQAPACRHPPAA